MNLVLTAVKMTLAEFDLQIDMRLPRQVTALFGPSGSGKTTLLDLVAGLRRPETGRIELGGVVLTDIANRIHVPPRLRQIGYVPQDLALFPHLSVRQNLQYGRKRRETEPGGLFSFEHVNEVLETAPLLEREVLRLSGGEKQRVCLARALLSSPRILLLDEPLSSLDTKLKNQILPYLKRVRDEFQLPMLYVTHDPAEAREICEDMITIERGRVIQPR